MVGKAAKRTAKRAERIQTVLGCHHDAVALEEWLKDAVAEIDPSHLSGVAAVDVGILIADVRLQRRKAREKWLGEWDAPREVKEACAGCRKNRAAGCLLVRRRPAPPACPDRSRTTTADDSLSAGATTQLFTVMAAPHVVGLGVDARQSSCRTSSRSRCRSREQ